MCVVQIEYRKEYSHHLGRDMEYKVYGHSGKPLLAFPTSFGSFWQWEGMGMIDAIAPFINDGRVQVWTVDGLDSETTMDKGWDKMAAAKRYDAYLGYVREELLPIIRNWSRGANGGFEHRIMVTGASMGAFHAANFFFHQPWHLDTLIAMSGAYSTDSLWGDYKPDEVSAYSPLNYLQGTFVDDRWLAYQRCMIILACGQGAWEEPMLTETKLLGDLLARRDIPAWIDLWGYDMDHDWPLWRQQLPYYLGKVLG
jgi:esterase/lipase superfamily enzyme